MISKGAGAWTDVGAARARLAVSDTKAEMRSEKCMLTAQCCMYERKNRAKVEIFGDLGTMSR